MSTLERQLLIEIREIVTNMTEEKEDLFEAIEDFIVHYYEQEEALEVIKYKLFRYYPEKGSVKTATSQMVEKLKQFFGNREQALLEFYDWGNPVALFIEKEMTLSAIKEELRAFPL